MVTFTTTKQGRLRVTLCNSDLAFQDEDTGEIIKQDEVEILIKQGKKTSHNVINTTEKSIRMWIVDDYEEELIRDIKTVLENVERANELDLKRLEGNITDEEYDELIEFEGFMYITLINYAKLKLGDNYSTDELFEGGEEDEFDGKGKGIDIREVIRRINVMAN